MNTHLKQDRKNMKQVKRKKNSEKLDKASVPDNVPVLPQNPSENNTEDEIIIVKRKKLRNKKKELVPQLQMAQQILGASKPMDKEEADLQKLIFGANPEDLDDEEDLVQRLVEENSDIPSEEKPMKNTLKPAWEDEDDESLLVKTKAKDLRNCHRSVSLRGEEKYSDYVQEKFMKIMGAPKWAEIGREATKDSGDESDDDLLRKTGNFIKKSESLPKGNINIRKCPNLFDFNMKASMVKTVEFHPTSKVALVATTNGSANLFQIDGKINAKIQSICFEDFPIETAHFTVDGREIIAGSYCRSHLFSYDMFAGKIVRIPGQKGIDQMNMRRFQMSPDGKYIVINGRYGNIHLMTTKSKEWIGTLKMNGEVISVTFNQDGTKMYSHGGTGEVYIWDIASRKCIHKFTDDGCVTGTAMALSPNEQFLTTGSDCGIVNVYDHKTVFKSTSPEPLKTLKNLTTEITHLKFNSTSELLSMSSNRKEEAVKLVHFPSLTVFSNFPTRVTGNSIKYVNSVDFSTNSGYYCIGINTGAAYIFRLKHYTNY